MIVFQVSLNFYTVKEILKIRCNIFILMEKVFILKKIHVAMYFQLFQFEPEQKIPVAMRATRKKLNIFTLQLPISYILA